jgi:hypothetical protein
MPKLPDGGYLIDETVGVPFDLYMTEAEREQMRAETAGMSLGRVSGLLPTAPTRIRRQASPEGRVTRAEALIQVRHHSRTNEANWSEAQWTAGREHVVADVHLADACKRDGR